MKNKIFTLVAALILFSGYLVAQTARVQVIHNSADEAAEFVDVYLNTQPLLTNFEFRTASEFIDAPAETSIEIAIAPAGTSYGDAVGTFDLTLDEDETYVIVANGIISATGYDPSPAFNLDVYAGAREEAMDASEVDVLVYHGSTDAPTVDVSEVTAGTLVNDISYSEFDGYLELPEANYTLTIDVAGNPVLAYSAPLADLGLAGEAITVLASGFLNPSINSDGADFGLWVALPSGGALVELPAPEPARAQIIHNSADEAAESVDIYINGNLVIPEVNFRTATPYVDLPSVVAFEVAIAPAGTSYGDLVASFNVALDEAETYAIVANGIVSGTGYDPSPAIDLDVYAGAREEAMDASEVDVLVYHGSTDAPTVDVSEVTAGTLVNGISYSEFDGYLELPEANYTLTIDVAGDPAFYYGAPLEDLGLGGQAITILASGFLNPSDNSDGASFGLWVALADGGDLVPLSNVTSVEEIAFVSEFNVYPNPTNSQLFVDFNLNDGDVTTVELYSINGALMKSISLGNIPSGFQRMEFDMTGYSEGIYFLQLTSGQNTKVSKVSVVK